MSTRSKPFRIYVASGADNRALIRVLERYLAGVLGPDVEFTAKWHRYGPIESATERAQMDFIQGIDISDFVLGVYPGGPGTTSEIGYALGEGKRVGWYSSEWDGEWDPLIIGLLKHRLDDLHVVPHSGQGWIARSDHELIDKIRDEHIHFCRARRSV